MAIEQTKKGRSGDEEGAIKETTISGRSSNAKLSLSRSFLLSIKWRLLRCLFLSVSFLSILRNDLPGVCRKCGGSRDETYEIKRTIRYLFFNLLIPIGTIFRSIYKVNKLLVYTLQYILATI